MMAVNRYRLRHRAKRGVRGAKLAVALLAQTDKLLGVILLGNTLVAAGAATLTAVITKRLFGEGELALGVGHRRHLVRAAGLFRNHAESRWRGARRHARAARELRADAACCVRPRPVVWFVNLFVQGLLKLLRPAAIARASRRVLSQEEMRSLVLEGHYFRGKHRALLANLFDLESISVDDVMTPRNQIEAHRPRRQAMRCSRSSS